MKYAPWQFTPNHILNSMDLKITFMFRGIGKKKIYLLFRANCVLGIRIRWNSTFTMKNNFDSFTFYVLSMSFLLTTFLKLTFALASESFYGCQESNFAPKSNREYGFLGQALTFGNAKVMLVWTQRKVWALTRQENEVFWKKLFTWISCWNMLSFALRALCSCQKAIFASK